MLKFIKKQFLIGIGTGFIISGVMISLFGVGEPTDEEIRSRAAKLGMISKEAVIQERESSSEVTDLPEAGSKNVVSPTNTAPTSVNQKAPEQTNKTATQTATQISTPPIERYVVVEIKPGMGSEKIAQILEDKGAVKSSDEFYKVVSAKKAHTKFRVGKFNVPVGGDMERILKILTGRI